MLKRFTNSIRTVAILIFVTVWQIPDCRSEDGSGSIRFSQSTRPKVVPLESVESSSVTDSATGSVTEEVSGGHSLTASEPMDFESELETLRKKLDELNSAQKELKSAEQKRSEAEKKAKETPSDKWNVKLGGHVQMDYINWANADPAIDNTHDYFEFRRLRLVADGTGYETCDFRLQLTLETESVGESAPGIITSPDVKDAYFSMNEIPFIGRLRIRKLLRSLQSGTGYKRHQQHLYGAIDSESGGVCR
ncbi:MAG: hypothetical protein JNL58_28755 [Planctomyces sp.]|nr:hypothetical protein [Planctomyces sp.]